MNNLLTAPRIAIICGHLDSFLPLAKETVYVNKGMYCRKHNYALLIPGSISPEFQNPRSHAGGFSWSRLAYLRSVLVTGQYEWVWTVGADTLITNMQIRLEDIIATACTPEAEGASFPPCPDFPDSPAPPKVIDWKPPPDHRWTGKKHLLICGERVTSMQADSFIMRSSPESVAYLDDLLVHYELYKHHVWVENQTMIDLRDKWAAITHMVPQWMMNCVDYSRWYGLRPQYRDNTDCYGNRGNWKPGDFLIHWPAGTIEERLGWLQKYSPHIIY